MAGDRNNGEDMPVVHWGLARSARTLAMVTVGGVAIQLMIALLSSAHSMAGMSLLDGYAAGTVTDADLAAWDAQFGDLGTVQLVVFTLTAFAWLAWQHRMVASVAPLGRGDPVTTPWKSVLWWIVPFANLVMVHRVYRDLARRFADGASSAAGLVSWWWGLYLGSGVVTQIASRYWLSEFTTVEQFNNGLMLWVASDLGTVVSAIVAILLLRRLQALQDLALAGPAVVEPVTGEDDYADEEVARA